MTDTGILVPLPCCLLCVICIDRVRAFNVSILLAVRKSEPAPTNAVTDCPVSLARCIGTQLGSSSREIDQSEIASVAVF